MRRFFKRLKEAWNDAFRQELVTCHFLGALASVAGNVLGSVFGGKKGGNTLEMILGGLGAGLSGLSGGGKIKPEEEYAAKYKYEKKLMDDRRQMMEAAGIKPKTDRYESYQYLSVLAPFMNKMIVGSFGSIMGEDAMAKYGIDLGSTLRQLGASPQGEEQPPIDFGGGPGGPNAPWFRRGGGM